MCQDSCFIPKDSASEGPSEGEKLSGAAETIRGVVALDHRTLEITLDAAVVADAPWIPLFHPIQWYLVKPYVADLTITPLGPFYAPVRIVGLAL